jgi:hypothetical protein
VESVPTQSIGTSNADSALEYANLSLRLADYLENVSRVAEHYPYHLTVFTAFFKRVAICFKKKNFSTCYFFFFEKKLYPLHERCKKCKEI